MNKVVIITIITIITIGGLYLFNNNLSILVPVDDKVVDDVHQSDIKVPEKVKPYLCGDYKENSNSYMVEFLIPSTCSQPLGLAVDISNKIWIAANWAGLFLIFDPFSNTFIKNVSLPDRYQSDIFGSMIWDMKFDKNGDLWYTDVDSNSIWRYFTQENKFEKYLIPTKGSYPSSLVLDSQNIVWFTEVFGKKLGMVNPSETENNTTKGIIEFDLSEKVNFDTMGPLTLVIEKNGNAHDINRTNKDDTLWLSSVNFPYDGQLVKFSISNRTFTIYDLNSTKSVPISVVEDENGMIWTNNHASSLFVMFDPQTGLTKQYSTSPASTRNTTTLPYFNEYRYGKVWFNEHEGNSIASYDINNKTLIEYSIPTRNELWGNTSNPLKFIFDNNGSIWFTEWTENKIGFIPKEKLDDLPISFSTSKDKIILDSNNGKGDTIDISIYKNNSNVTANDGTASINNELKKSANISMYATSSISKSGILWNLTSNFSTNRFTISGVPSYSEPYKTTLEINPTAQVVPGNYTLTISARYNNDLTYSKIIDMIII